MQDEFLRGRRPADRCGKNAVGGVYHGGKRDYGKSGHTPADALVGRATACAASRSRCRGRDSNPHERLLTAS